MQSVPNVNPFLTYNFCSDGLSLFNNSKGSVWPIFMTINELPLDQRNKYILLAGVWFGKTEPKFDVFLKPFVEQAQVLADQGLDFYISGKKLTVKVFPACCCVDSTVFMDVRGACILVLLLRAP